MGVGLNIGIIQVDEDSTALYEVTIIFLSQFGDTFLGSEDDWAKLKLYDQ